MGLAASEKQVLRFAQDDNFVEFLCVSVTL